MKIFDLQTSKLLIWLGIGLFFIGIILFIINDFTFNSEAPLDSEKFGHFSDYVGGIIGSFWALAGVILFYVALTDQREDIENNRQVLITQVEALNNQIEEFGLQRDEMRLTRKIFNEQSITLKKQQFESTFFSSLNLLNELIKDINYLDKIDIKINFLNPPIFPVTDKSKLIKGRESFTFFYREFKRLYSETNDEYVQEKLFPEDAEENSISLEFDKKDEEAIINRSFGKLFNLYQSQLGHYFRTIYNIIRFIDKEQIKNPKYYTNLVRAQLSTYEHLLLFYNCISGYGNENFKPLIIKYNLLDNISISDVIHPSHKELYPEKAYQ